MRPFAIAMVLCALTSGCTRPMVVAGERDKAALAAFQAGKHDNCIALYNDAIERYLAFSQSYAPASPSHWWGIEWAARSRMGRAHCYRAQGKLKEAISDLEQNIKISLEANENDPNTLESIKQKSREHAADMTETLAKWKKEMAAQYGQEKP